MQDYGLNNTYYATSYKLNIPKREIIENKGAKGPERVFLRKLLVFRVDYSILVRL